MKTLIHYLEGLTVSQGRLAGQSLRVQPWQHRFVRSAFAPGVQSAALSVARGNGKTALLSGIAAATLDGPLAVPRGETVIVASSFEQARIAFEHVVAFMGDKLADKGRWKVWDTAQQARVEDRICGARVRCIGSDPRRAHGLAPVLVLADEPAQWPETTGERMVAALRTAAGKQPHSRFVALGTRPADAEHWFSKMLSGGADYAQCHAARAGDSTFQRRTWAKANPSLGHMPDLETAIRNEAVQAKRDPSLLAAFEALRLNLGTEDAAVSVLVSAELWRGIEGAAETGGGTVWGVDLGTTAAQSAIACYWPETGRPGRPGGVPWGAEPCRARAEGRSRRSLRRVRPPGGLDDARRRGGGCPGTAGGGPGKVRSTVPDRGGQVARGGAEGRLDGGRRPAGGARPARHGVQRRRRGCPGVPAGVRRGAGDSSAEPAAALGDG